MIDFVAKRYLFFLISAILIIPGLISLVIPPGLQLGVDFTGGTLWEVRFDNYSKDKPVPSAVINEVLTAHGFPDSLVQVSNGDVVLIRAKEIRPDLPVKNEIAADLQTRLGSMHEQDFQSVGPSVGTEVWQRSMMAIGLVSFGILVYLWWAFRKVPRPYAFGVCAVVALLHDALLLLGIFSILGRLFHVEIDALFVTALLTVIGFSVHDTIVVFDRVRENSTRHFTESFATVVNHSLAQTMGRSVTTSLTVVFTLAALTLFGGASTRDFALALLIGIVSGTYSSIFNATMLLVMWETGELQGIFRRIVPIKAAA